MGLTIYIYTVLQVGALTSDITILILEMQRHAIQTINE